MFEDISKVLLITDMDGTFLPTDKIPSKGNLKAIKRFQNAGGKFTIATGRAHQATSQYFEYFEVNFPMIMFNGGMIYDMETDKSIYDIYTPPVSKEITIDILNKFPNLGCEILTKKVNVISRNETEENHIKICKVTPNYTDVDNVEDNWYKVLFADTKENLDIVEDYVSQRKFTGVDFVRSDLNYFEILPQENSKGSALKAMRKLCNIEDYTIVAVGDYNNDIQMLIEADLGVCPANAVDAVKDVADLVLNESCDENAIAAVIDYIFSKVN